LIHVKARLLRCRHSRGEKEQAMPLTDILVLGVIVLAFAAFGTTLAWGDYQTRDTARDSRRKALISAKVVPLISRSAYAEHKAPDKAKARDAVQA
jgi:hypothetical protein